MRSLKPSRGNAKHVTVLKESVRSEVRRVHKACPYHCIARTHVLSNLLFRYSLVPLPVSPPPLWLLLFSGLLTCIPNPDVPFPEPSGTRDRIAYDVCRMVIHRYPIFDYKPPRFRLALTINYPSPLSSLCPSSIPRFNYLGRDNVRFIRATPCGNSERIIYPSMLDCDAKTYWTCLRDVAKFNVENNYNLTIICYWNIKIIVKRNIPIFLLDWFPRFSARYMY